jgi:F-type H+-transporting ATPase subunit b
MRIRKLLAVVLATLALSAFFLARPASAAEEPSHEAEECIELLEEGKEPEDCAESPSLILPATNEIVWGALSFLLLFFAMSKFAYPAIKKMTEARTERIREDLGAADTAKAEAQTVLEEYRAQLADAKTEASRIIEEARVQADSLKRDQEARLQTELADMRAKAMTDIEGAKNQIMADLRGEVADLAIGAAEAVVQRNLDRDTQLQLIENYINQVGQRP